MRWDGEILFEPHLFAYRGSAGDNALHAHASLQITASRVGSVEIVDKDGKVHSGPVLYVRAGVPHQLRTDDQVVLLLIEPQSRLAQEISEGLGTQDIAPLSGTYRTLLDNDPPLAELAAHFAPHAENKPLDPRLSTALEFLAEAPLMNAIKRAAAHSGLSESRLRAISQQQLGIPLSKYLLWRAVGRAGRALMAGSTLADSAAAGGFSDQAHFTRTMKRLMGVTPGQAHHALS